MAIEYRAPKNTEELNNTLECIAYAFGGGREWALPFFTNIAIKDPWFALQNLRVCFVNGKAVSAVEIFDRTVRYGSSSIRMAGIGSVGTHPDHRRAGYSIEVLKDTVHAMRDQGYDFSLLWAGVPNHYRRMGWMHHPEYHQEITIPETIPQPSGNTTIETCDLQHDVTELQTIYNHFNNNRTGTLIRTEEYWIKQPQWRNYDPDRFYIARKNGHIVAYLKTKASELQELGYLPEGEAEIKDLLIHFFNRAQNEEHEKINAHLPAETYSLLAEMGYSIRRTENRNSMLRLVNTTSLLTKIIPELEHRLKASEHTTYSGTIRLTCEMGTQSLTIQNGQITPTDNAPDIELIAGQTQLLGLLFGAISADHIAFTNALPLTDHQIAIINALFPSDEFFLWGTDRF